MNTPRRRGSAAIIALIVLAMTGLTVMSYVTSSTSTAAADAAAVAGWRALYATDAGIAATVAAIAEGETSATMPPITGAPAVTIAGSRSAGFSYTAESARSRRSTTAWVTIGSTGRPIVTSWHMYTGTLVTDPPPEDASGSATRNRNNETETTATAATGTATPVETGSMAAATDPARNVERRVVLASAPDMRRAEH